MYGSFQAELRRRYRSEGVRALPGAELAFGALRAAGIRVALNTGFDQEITGMLLEVLGWAHGQVDAVVCGDQVAQVRPAPYLIFRAMEAAGCWRVRGVATVGDTALDLQAGDHAGVRWNIGVLSGAHDRRTLEGAPHTHLLGGVAEVAALWGLSPEPEAPPPAAVSLPPG